MVTPFSGKGHSENQKRSFHLNLDPCVICGRPVRHPKYWLVVVDGGSAFGDTNSDPNDPGYMGGFPIGPDCLAQHPELKPLAYE